MYAGRYARNDKFVFDLFQILPRITFLVFNNITNRPFRHDIAAFGSPFRTQVYHPIRAFYHIRIMFYY